MLGLRPSEGGELHSASYTSCTLFLRGSNAMRVSPPLRLLASSKSFRACTEVCDFELDPFLLPRSRCSSILWSDHRPSADGRGRPHHSVRYRGRPLGWYMWVDV